MRSQGAVCALKKIYPLALMSRLVTIHSPAQKPIESSF